MSNTLSLVETFRRRPLNRHILVKQTDTYDCSAPSISVTAYHKARSTLLFGLPSSKPGTSLLFSAYASATR